MFPPLLTFPHDQHRPENRPKKRSITIYRQKAFRLLQYPVSGRTVPDHPIRIFDYV